MAAFLAPFEPFGKKPIVTGGVKNGSLSEGASPSSSHLGAGCKRPRKGHGDKKGRRGQLLSSHLLCIPRRHSQGRYQSPGKYPWSMKVQIKRALVLSGGKEGGQGKRNRAGQQVEMPADRPGD